MHKDKSTKNQPQKLNTKLWILAQQSWLNQKQFLVTQHNGTTFS